MLKYGTPSERKTYLNFDMKTMTRASGLLLGQKKTNEYLKNKTRKNILKWIGELEEEALIIRKNKNKEFPSDVQSQKSKESLESERIELSEEILQLKGLYNLESKEIESLIRIRSLNQFIALNKSGLEEIKKKDNQTEQVLRVSLKDLNKFVKESESSGETTLRFEVKEDDVEFTKTQLKKSNLTLLFRDELTQRPEPKRNFQGNLLRSILRDSKSKNVSPQQEAYSMGETFTGTPIVLTRNGKATEVKEVKNENGVITLEVNIFLPEIREEINKDPKGTAGTGSITDRMLKQHCSNEYGCNGRDFVKASQKIVDSLNQNLEEATKQWLSKSTEDSVTKDEIERFLKEYYTLTVCLEEDFKSIDSLSPIRATVKRVNDILPSTEFEEVLKIEAPESSYSKDAIGEQRINMPSSSAILAGKDWLKQLTIVRLEEKYNTRESKEYTSTLERIFGIKDVSRKLKLIESNYNRIPNGQTPSQVLDGGPSEIRMIMPALTNEMDKEFEEREERQNQEIFDSKAGELKDYEGPNKKEVKDDYLGRNITIATALNKKHVEDKTDFIMSQKKLTLTLPYRGEILRRLTKYPTRQSGLKIGRTEAEKFDEEISLSTKARKATPKQADGRLIRIEDCLSGEGLEDLKTKSSEEKYQKEINRIKNILEEWQNQSRTISASNKSPLDRAVYRWLMGINSNDLAEKADSISELSQIFNGIVSSAGQIPFETERSQDRFATPLRSSPIPLMLLCGTGFDNLYKEKDDKSKKPSNDEDGLSEIEGTIAEDPASSFDMVMRWTNAENLHRMPLKDTAEEKMSELENLVETGSNSDILKHAVSLELNNPPNFVAQYLENLGAKNGKDSIPQEYRHFGTLAFPLDHSPENTIIDGEELPIALLQNILKEKGIEIKLSDKESEEIANSAELALSNWRKQCVNSLKELDALKKASKEDTTVTVFLDDEISKEDETEDPFLVTISKLHETMPQSEDDLKNIMVSLLSHEPNKLTLNTQEGEIVLTRGTNNQWTSKSKHAKVNKAIELVSRAQSIISSNEQTPEDSLVLLEAQKISQKELIYKNIEKLRPAIQSLNKGVLELASVKTLCEPILILTRQVEEAKKAKELGLNLLKDWLEVPEEKDNPWGYSQSILSPTGTVEYFCEKITGKTSSKEFDQYGEPVTEEKTSTYFSRQLISQEDKMKAIDLIKSSGNLNLAGAFLKEQIQNNGEALLEQAAITLPGLINDLKSEIQKSIEYSHEQQTIDYITKSSALCEILKDKTKYRILEEKIKKELVTLNETKTRNTNKGDRSKPNEVKDSSTQEESPSAQIHLGRGTKSQTKIQAKNNTIEVNKLWAKKWLETKMGQTSLNKRINLINWVKSLKNDITPKTAIAFLEFCHHRHLVNVPEAISNGSLPEGVEKTIRAAATKFSKCLKSIRIDTENENPSLKTQLLGAYTLNQGVGKYSQTNWKKEIEDELSQIKSTETNIPTSLKVEYCETIDGEGIKAIKSPYLKLAEERAGIDLEENIESADPKTKLKTVKRAVSVLYKSLPMDIGISPKGRQKDKKTQKHRETEVVI